MSQTPAAPALVEPDESRPGLIDLFNVALRYRRSLIAIPLAFGLLGGLIRFLSPRTYTASAAFVLNSSGSSASRFAGIAAQFGLPAGSASGETPQLYSQLVRSTRVLMGVSATRYDVKLGGKRVRGTYPEIMEISGDSPEFTRQAILESLREAVSSQYDAESGLVAYSVRTVSPELSRKMAERILDLLREYNVDTRRSQAAMEREFTGKRLEAVSVELRRAEDALQGFLQGNRVVDGSPRLMFDRDRLQRTVVAKQALFTMLQQSYEQARIDEVRDQPVLTMVDLPSGSVVPDARGTVSFAFVMFMVGVIVAVGAAIVREVMRKSRERQSPEMLEFISLRDEVRVPLLHRKRAAGNGVDRLSNR